MGMKWLITGGCGFIGRNLIRMLLSQGGHSVRVVDNLKTGTCESLSMVCDFDELKAEDCRPINDAGHVELVVADILDGEAVEMAAQGCEIMVHLAANTGVAPSVADPKMDCATNVMGTLNCLEAARKVNARRFIFASSGAPAGEVEPPIHEEMVPKPVSPYGASKLAGEAYCCCYSKTFGLETVALRFGNVYGELSGHKDSVVARFIRKAVEGKPLEIYGDGTQTRDFIYIEDLIRAVLFAAEKKDVGGEVFQIATSTETTLLELVDVLVPVLEKHGLENVKVVHSERRTGDVLRNFSDTSKAARMLGWQADTSLESGLEKTVAWFLNA